MSSQLRSRATPADKPWLTDAEVFEAIRAHHWTTTRKRFYAASLGNNVVNTYGVLRKLVASSGTDTTTVAQVARHMYDEVTPGRCNSVQRWLHMLRDAGVIELETLRRDDGFNLGLRFRLISRSSSAGQACVIRARESHAERASARVRPWCRRSGRGARPRLQSAPAGPPFFTSRDLVPPGPSGGSVPTGPPPLRHRYCRTGVRARPGAGGIDTNEPEQHIEAGGRARDDGGQGRRGRGSVALPPELERLESVCREFFPASVALSHPPTIARLTWVLARLDRYGNFGRGSPGAGAALAIGLLGDLADQLDAGHPGQPPRSLAYLLPELEKRARRWKHQWAPKIKDARIAAGVRPPRRAAPRKPGHRPPLGWDPKMGPGNLNQPKRRRRRG